MAPTRVVVADDDVLLREGIASLLSANGYDVVAQARSGPDLLHEVRRERPDVAIVDIRMPPTNTTEGLDAALTIRAELPQTGVLLLSAHVEVDTAMDLVAGGERVGYLLKRRVSDVRDFLDAVERVTRGGSVVDPALVLELVDRRRRDDPLAELSERERDVLALMAEGRSNAGIARQLIVTEGTVEKHVRSILSKLGLEVGADDHRRVLAVLAYLDAN
jgi:DNA-binding NarL/FixJ family response regulator